MKKLILIFSVVFLLTTVYTIAPADVVSGAVLYLDAADNSEHDDAWENLGTAGGELSGEGNPPKLEKGTIAVPALEIEIPNSSFYTHKESGQCFGGPGDTVELFLDDWTIEFLLRRNGLTLGDEHQLAGFQTFPQESVQGIRLNFWEAEDQLTFSIHSKGAKAGVAPLGITLEEGAWNWIALVHKNKDSLTAYQNGEEVSDQAGWEFDKETPIDIVIIGANSYWERARTFNGSVSIVRVYDKALTEGRVHQNINAWAGRAVVEPDSKLTTTWGTVKTVY